MKIVIFMEDYYLGGVDTFVINLINSWPDDSDEIYLICNSKHTGLSYLKKAISRPAVSIKTHSLAIYTAFFELKGKRISDQCFILLLRLLSPLLRYIFTIYNIFALRQIFKPLMADRLIVINGGYPGGDSCRAASICWGIFSQRPLAIHSIHGIAIKPRWHVALQEFALDLLLSYYTEKFVTVSDAVAQTLLCRKGINPSKLKTIYNGVSFKERIATSETKESLKKRLGIMDTSRLCLIMGGYHVHKNFDKGYEFAITVFKKVLTSIPEAHLVICGYGSNDDITKVRNLAVKHNIKNHVHLYGFITDISLFLASCDLVLITSQKFESFCFASIEAWAYRVPVVATKVGGIPEIVIDNYGGYCVDKFDGDKYAKYVISLLSDESLRVQQGQRGFERYKMLFSDSRMAREYAEILVNTNIIKN